MISDNHRAVNSEIALMESIHKLTDAGVALIQVRTREPVRASIVLRKNLIGADTPYTEWDIINGFRTFTTENYTDHRVKGGQEEFYEALSRPLNDLRNPTSQVNAVTGKIHYFVYIDTQLLIKDNPPAISLLQQYSNMLPSTNVCILLITPETKLDVPHGTVLVTDLETPGLDELSRVVNRMVADSAGNKSDFPGGNDVDKDACNRIAQMGLGLTMYEFETYLAIAIIEAGARREKKLTAEALLNGVAVGKTMVVRQSEILELTHPESVESVGGMQRLKDWLNARAGCYSEQARDFGVESPKGMVLVGVPGTGKSLVAKVTASILGVPLVRLDFGRVFSRYVGDSESRVRDALKMVEAMAPVVLFSDEIDKGLGNSEGGGDSGVSSRVLGTFLTWLQECTAPVFVVVTANRVRGLPPELLRRGRFDQIWSVTMPDADERREVLDIHLRKRGRSLEDFAPEEVEKFIASSDGYVPAEIESAVKDGLVIAFNDDKAEGLEMAHILKALDELVPMSKSHKEAIDQIITWASGNATPVNYPRKAGASAPAHTTRLLGRNRRT